MDLSKILSIAGKPGLYQMISQSKSGLIVESLNDGRRIPAFSHERISSLEEISIFTETDDIPLKDVLTDIYKKENGGKTISHKSSAKELKELLKSVLPDYDEERVYVSDIKKLVNWYNQLVDKDLIDISEEEKEDEEKVEVAEEDITQEEPKKK